MSTIQEIERAATGLEGEEPVEWDRQVEEDIAAARLDALADEAVADLRAGRTQPM